MIPRIRPTSPAAAAVLVKSNSKRSELYEAPNGRESITSSLTGFGTNSSLAGLGGLGNKESGKGYRVGTTEEFVFPGGIPRDRLDFGKVVRAKVCFTVGQLLMNCCKSGVFPD